MRHRHIISRQLLLIMRNALGRFTRVRAVLAPKGQIKRRPRPAAMGVQLALF